MREFKDIQQAEFDFSQARACLRTAQTEYTLAATDLVNAGGNRKQLKLALAEDGMKKIVKIQKKEPNELRGQITKAATMLAMETKLDFHAFWVALYVALKDRTGYNAPVRAKLAGDKTILDTVERDGKLPELHQILQAWA